MLSEWVRGEATAGREGDRLVACYLQPTALLPPFNLTHAENLSAWAGQIDDPATLKASAALMGLLAETSSSWFQGAGDARIDTLVAERDAAKKARDFATSDRIRDALKAEGIIVEDGPTGTSWRRA